MARKIKQKGNRRKQEGVTVITTSPAAKDSNGILTDLPTSSFVAGGSDIEIATDIIRNYTWLSCPGCGSPVEMIDTDVVPFEAPCNCCGELEVQKAVIAFLRCMHKGHEMSVSIGPDPNGAVQLQLGMRRNVGLGCACPECNAREMTPANTATSIIQ